MTLIETENFSVKFETPNKMADKPRGGSLPPPPSALPDLSSLGLGASRPTNPFAPRQSPVPESQAQAGGLPPQPPTYPDLPKPSSLPPPKSCTPPAPNLLANVGKTAEAPRPAVAKDLTGTVGRDRSRETEKTSHMNVTEPHPAVGTQSYAPRPLPATTGNATATVPVTAIAVPPPTQPHPVPDQKDPSFNYKPRIQKDEVQKKDETARKEIPIPQEAGMFGWLTKTVNENPFLAQVATKAKAGMETVLTTLDPSMREYLSGEGALEVFVGTDDPNVSAAVRQGFEKVFHQVIVRGVPSPQASDLTALCTGRQAAIDLCTKRASMLSVSRLSSPSSPVIVFQPFIIEMDKDFFSSTLIFLRWRGFDTTAVSQLLPLSDRLMKAIKSSSGSQAGQMTLPTAVIAAQVYGSCGSWDGPCPPYGDPNLLINAASVVAFELRRKMTELKEKANEGESGDAKKPVEHVRPTPPPQTAEKEGGSERVEKRVETERDTILNQNVGEEVKTEEMEDLR